jgi:hypothetical protein
LSIGFHIDWIVADTVTYIERGKRRKAESVETVEHAVERGKEFAPMISASQRGKGIGVGHRREKEKRESPFGLSLLCVR